MNGDFIDPSRIQELRDLPPVAWDLSRLVRLCKELNASYKDGSYHAVAALTRALLDHVPPIFGLSSFKEVANNYAGGQSFRDTMQFLESGARKIGDSHLHTRVRDREVLPNRTQVNFAPAIDVLLGEIVRIHKISSGRLQQAQATICWF